MATDTLEQIDTDQATDNGDHDKFSHYVPKEAILEAAINGTLALALCGKLWLPNSDPDNFGVCPECKDVYEGLKA